MKSPLLTTLAAAALIATAACADSSENAAATGGAGGAGTAGTGTVRPGSQEDLVANVGDRVFFDFDRSNIRADQRPVLDRQAAWLQQYPQVTVTVEGEIFDTLATAMAASLGSAGTDRPGRRDDDRSRRCVAVSPARS